MFHVGVLIWALKNRVLVLLLSNSIEPDLSEYDQNLVTVLHTQCGFVHVCVPAPLLVVLQQNCYLEG